MRRAGPLLPSAAGPVLLLLLLCLPAYALWPRTADLRAFDPAAVARLETGMWRDYYERHYAALVSKLYRLNREQYGFSPWESARLSFYAADAARRFQPSRSRAAAQAALPVLERYFELIRNNSKEKFDAREAARLELEWWQLRREDRGPEECGRAVARAAAVVYGTDAAALVPWARLRAEMMHYRDERSGRMGEQDWRYIEEELDRAYTMLRAAVGGLGDRRTI